MKFTELLDDAGRTGFSGIIGLQYERGVYVQRVKGYTLLMSTLRRMMGIPVVVQDVHVQQL